MGDTAIGWTHRPGTRGRTWNPVRGCRRKSAGCLHCYAEVQAARIVRMGKGRPTPYDELVRVVAGEARWTGEISIDADRLAEPLRWRKRDRQGPNGSPRWRSSAERPAWLTSTSRR